MFLRECIIYSFHRLKKILPRVCALCGYFSSNIICKHCECNLPRETHACRICGQALYMDRHDNLVCGICYRSPPAFDCTFSLFSYQPPIDGIIHKLKFQHNMLFAEMFGQLFSKRIQSEWYLNQSVPDLIIPVPLHTNRLRERGFNQSAEIAKTIRRIINIKIDLFNIVRIKETLPQHTLPARLREQNLYNAFDMAPRIKRKDASQKIFQNLFVAVIDDVMTTGQTLNTLCKLIKENGAKKIHVWCCARRC